MYAVDESGHWHRVVHDNDTLGNLRDYARIDTPANVEEFLNAHTCDISIDNLREDDWWCEYSNLRWSPETRVCH